MCGIIGYSLNNPLIENQNNLFIDTLDLEERLAASNDLLSHRGPDDSGLFFDHQSGIGLGHRRLSIIDTSKLGKQPMSDSDKRVHIVYNGEIYNFRELRKDLEKKGFEFISNSDTEVLLYLYIYKGKDMLNELNGIFSLAIWDSRTEELFLARDALGIKPLYYYLNEEIFIFSSEIKALLNLIEDERDLDFTSLHRYLSFLWCPGEDTPLKHVKKLNPGELLYIKKGSIQKRETWYSLPFQKNSNKKLTKSKSEYIDELTSILRASVHRQMVSDVPVGAFLSGGLDSSSVVALAREIDPKLKCFTIETGSTDSGMTEDLPYAKKVAEHLNVPLEIVSVTPQKMIEDFEDMIIQLDEPLADVAPLNVKYISRIAREHGIKVLLSGAGGDDLFTGYRRHLAVRIDEYINFLPVSLRSRIEESAKLLNQNLPFFRRFSKFFKGSSLSPDERLINYFIWSSREDLNNLYSDEFKAGLGDYDAKEPMLNFLHTLPEHIESLDKMLALDQRFFLTDHNLIYTDKMSMAEGVEVRVPLLDIKLVEFSYSIPNKWKQKGTTGKWIFKKAMEPYLPRDVIYRPKTGFGVPLRQWMRFELREFLGDMLSEESINKRGLFNAQAISELVVQNDEGKIDASYTLLSLLSIEIWCRNYLDAPKKATSLLTK